MSTGIIFAIYPDYGRTNGESARAFWANSLRKGSPLLGRLYQDRWPGSFEAGNAMLAAGLNGQEGGMDITRLVMLHNDVIPQPGWVDMLDEDMDRTGADLLSVVIPIKDPLGLSSVAIDNVGNPFEIERRLTMTEVHDLPETFTAEDCGYESWRLLVNTGCMMLDWTKPWRNLVNPDGSLLLTFTSPDRVSRRGPDNKWQSEHSPSDWKFSRDLNRLGAKVVATRKIKAFHVGDFPYTNERDWGDWKVDEALQHKWGGVPVGAYKNPADRRAAEKSAIRLRERASSDTATSVLDPEQSTQVGVRA